MNTLCQTILKKSNLIDMFQWNFPFLFVPIVWDNSVTSQSYGTKGFENRLMVLALSLVRTAS